jgi:hypothetical protein
MKLTLERATLSSDVNGEFGHIPNHMTPNTSGQVKATGSVLFGSIWVYIYSYEPVTGHNYLNYLGLSKCNNSTRANYNTYYYYSMNSDGTATTVYQSTIENNNFYYEYTCNGHCNNHYICGGHANCLGHKDCDGHKMVYCTGHLDLKTHYAIRGIKDQKVVNNKLVYTDQIFNIAGTLSFFDEQSDNDVKNACALMGDGTTSTHKMTRNKARTTYQGDWADLYGICLALDYSVPLPLSEAEIQSVLGDGVDEGNNTDAARLALSCVSNLPYHDNYYIHPDKPDPVDMDDQTYSITEQISTIFNGAKTSKVYADKKGRLNAGLNHASFVSYIYYSTRGRSFVRTSAAMKTQLANTTYYKSINKAGLKPGDIIVEQAANGNRKHYIYISTNATNGSLNVVTCSNADSTVVYETLIVDSGTFYYYQHK